MLALYIIAFVIALVIILLIFPVRIKLHYHDKLIMTAYYLFFKYQITDKKEKKKKKTNIKKAPLKEKPKPPHDKAFEFIRTAIQDYPNTLMIEQFFLKLGIIGTDVANTAISYGAACSVIYPAIAFIKTKINIKKLDIDVYADYNSDKVVFEFLVVFKFRPIFVLKMIIDFLNISNKNKDGAKK